MSEPPIKLDLEKAFSVAITGIIRASVFSGFILNPQNKFEINSWQINDAFKLCNNEFNDKTKEEAYIEFKKWIVKNSLREMMEYLDYSLTQIYDYSYRIVNYPKNIDNKVLEKELKNFNNSKNGFPEKIDKINNLLNNKLTEEKKYWKALQKIRNSITHNLGICSKKSITLAIPEIKTIAVTKDKKEINFKPGEAIDMSKYSLKEIKFDYRTKTYKRNEVISFSNEDIMYIIWGMQQAIGSFQKSVLEKAFQMKIPVFDKNSNQIINKFEDFVSDKDLLNIKMRNTKNV